MADHRGEDAGEALGLEGGQRLDKWLWFARIAKSRTFAAQLVTDGKVRVNRVRAAKSSQIVRPGDVLTITIRGQVLVVRVREPGERRGPPPSARLLYDALEQLGGRGAPRDQGPRSRKPDGQGQ